MSHEAYEGGKKSRLCCVRAGAVYLALPTAVSAVSNILFVCTMNLCRSRTAHEVYRGTPGLGADSAGLHTRAVKRVSADLLIWAHRIFVFEREHSGKLRELFPTLYPKLCVECLHIPDDYGYMDSRLVTRLLDVLPSRIGEPARGPAVRKLIEDGGTGSGPRVSA